MKTCNMKYLLPHMKGKWPFLFFLIWFGGTYWMVSERFVDETTAPKACFALFGAVIFCALCTQNEFHGEISRIFRFTDMATAIMLCAVSQAIYVILQKTGICAVPGTFPACGSFDNPAGVASALAFSLPFGLGLINRRHPYIQKVSWASMAIIVTGIIVSESRSGILAACMVMFVFFVMRRKCIRKLWVIFPVVGFVAAVVFLYHYKQDSADGRLLIWRCTWSVIRESPWIGHGIGGFQARYMDAQADYFKAHPESPYVMLADNTQAPFNEYLGLLTEFGFAGGIILLVGAALLLRAWWKHPCGSSRVAILCLLSIAVFSLFSYPFRYAHTWLLCGISVVVLLFNAYSPAQSVRRIIFLSATLCFVGVSCFSIHRMRIEMCWREVATCSLGGMTDEMLPAYHKLYGELGKNPYFLYNYAAELNVSGHYAESLRIGQECDALMADYFVQLLMADNCKQLKRYEQAKRYLGQASYMCPNRFVPLYELYKIYELQANTVAMCRMAEAILRKPIKVESSEVHRIIAEMKRYKQGMKSALSNGYK